MFDLLKSRMAETGWVVFGQVSLLVCNVLLIKILTTSFDKTSYGEIVLALSIAGAINILFYGPFAQSILRYYSVYRDNNKLESYFFVVKNVIRVSVAINILLIFLFVLILTNVTGDLHQIKITSIILSLCYGLTSGVVVCKVAIASAQRNRKHVVAITSSDAWLRVALCVSVIMLLSTEVIHILISYCVASLVVILYQSKYLNLTKDHDSSIQEGTIARDELNVKKVLLKYTGSFVILAVFSVISLYADRWVLSHTMLLTHVATYAVLLQVSNAPIAFIGNLISTLVAPILFSKAGSLSDKNKVASSESFLSQILVTNVALAAIIFFVYYYFGKNIISLVTTSEYADSAHLLTIVGMAQVLILLGQQINLRAQVVGKPLSIVPSYIVRAFSYLILGYFLSRYSGLEGMSIAFLISSILYVAVSVVMMIMNSGLKKIAA